MSGRYQLTPSARDDLHHLEDITLDRFGFSQALALNEALETAFVKLGNNPYMGHIREDLSPAGRDFRYWTVKQRFLIVYEPTDSGIIVVRIFDRAQDVQSELPKEG